MTRMSSLDLGSAWYDNDNDHQDHHEDGDGDDSEDRKDDNGRDDDGISPLPLLLHPAGLALHVSVLSTPVPHITPSHCNDDDHWEIASFHSSILWSNYYDRIIIMIAP